MVNDAATYTQLKFKCLKCGLHFVICTWNPESHALTTVYCPECGQHESKFILWSEVVEGFIYQTVPGEAQLLSMTY